MTTITSNPSTAAASTTATGASGSSTPLDANFNMFLKLLTAQMQNQDPLSPMDTTQYTQQLVQYSQVEQEMASGGTLKSILAGMSTQNLSQASGLIGHQVTVASATAGLGASPAIWNYSAPRALSKLSATITDASGHVVETRSLDPSNAQGSFNWNGSLSSGGTAPAGSYTLNLSGADANGADVPITVSTSGAVTGVQMGGGNVTLTINGQPQPLSSVSGVTDA